MIQITYQPAYDPYHTAFRVLMLLARNEEKSIRLQTLKILDFYLAFPNFIQEINGIKTQIKKHNLDTISPPYGHLPSSKIIFNQMNVFQEAAVQTLHLRGILEFTSETLAHEKVKLTKNKIPENLLPALTRRNDEKSNILTFLSNVLMELPLEGAKGLKSKTSLMEHRYDYQ